MKKASDVLLLIGAIFVIFGALGTLIFAIISGNIMSPSFKDTIIKGIQDGSIKIDIPGTVEEKYQFLMVVFQGLLIGCIIATLVQVALAVISFIAISKKSKGLYITSIVLSVLAGLNILTFLGGIFGLVGNSEQQQ